MKIYIRLDGEVDEGKSSFTWDWEPSLREHIDEVGAWMFLILDGCMVPWSTKEAGED